MKNGNKNKNNWGSFLEVTVKRYGEPNRNCFKNGEIVVT